LIISLLSKSAQGKRNRRERIRELAGARLPDHARTQGDSDEHCDWTRKKNDAGASALVRAGIVLDGVLVLAQPLRLVDLRLLRERF
jgi:hypothetical protein